MAEKNVVIQNYSQTEVTYPSVPKVWLKSDESTDENLVLVPFSYGEAVENVPISLDFSSGENQTITAPDGTLVKSAVIEKPVDLIPENIRRGKVIAGVEGDFIGDTEEIAVDGDNDLTFAGGESFVVEPSSADKVISKVTISPPSELVPANIAKGVTIAGIEGTHEGGGGGTQEIVRASGEYTPSAEGNVTIEHNLGVIPDIIMIQCDSSKAGYLYYVFASAEEIAQDDSIQRAIIWNASKNVSLVGSSSIFADDTSGYGFISSANPRKFDIGGSIIKNNTDATYSWAVIGGLVSRSGYFFMRLALDGNGNLIVTGGVSAIQQLNIYVDGALAKTVDYVHANEVTIDISDVAGEFQEYTITVEGVGENLNSQYPYSFYDTVTGYTVSLGGSCGASAYWRLTGDGTLTIYGEGAMDDYAAATDQPWNAYASMIKTASVENGITAIGNAAFRDITTLEYIFIADSVSSIGQHAIRGTAIKSIDIPYGITTLPYCFVYACSNLTNVTIPNSVTSLDSYAFGNCTSLSIITLPDSLTSIGTYAFRDCAFESLVIPNGVTSINNNVFDSCASLVSIDIPESVTSIGNYAFQNCSKLSAVNLSDNLTSIGTYAFYKCISLKSITIPAGVTRIENSALRGCSSLATINILGDITFIGEYAFADSIITSFVIPDTVTEIGRGTFYACTKLKSLTISNNLAKIPNTFAYNCTALTSITIPSSVTSIDTNAFGACSRLTSATFKVTSGWWRSTSASATSGTTISSSYLSNTSTAATYLISTYAGYYWKRT